MFFLFDQSEALNQMRVDQLKKTWVKNIGFKNTFLNYFSQHRFYPYMVEKMSEKHLSNRYKTPKIYINRKIVYLLFVVLIIVVLLGIGILVTNEGFPFGAVEVAPVVSCVYVSPIDVVAL